jgi:DNA topoisomerase I
MFLINEDISLSNETIKSILHDPEKSAQAANLIYVCDTQPGIQRIRKGKKFIYMQNGNVINDQAVLGRIKKLVIPPAWENVWICPLENGHLQVTGLDVKKRKQYKYHAVWNSLRNHTKFYRLHSFGKVIPAIRERIEKDLGLPGLPLHKVLAAVVCLMERTSIRIGNNLYEKLYGSFGLTTLKDKHVKIKGAEMQFIFKGKL